MTDERIDHVERLAKVIGATWSIRILCLLDEQSLRFTEIANKIKVSRRILSLRLTELQQLELITKERLPVVPAQSTYSLTKTGASLLKALCDV